jgi:hypothetical protein
MQPIFARIVKVDERTRTVTGRAAQEVVDRSGEIFDYKTSKPEFQKWSAEIYSDSQGKSYGNVRSMHGNIAAGKLTAITFDDVEKAVDITAKIVDDQEWEKICEGVHTGFSIGGTYKNKRPEVMAGKMVTRYTAIPSEISLVDRPCIPTAKFDFTKRDGSIVRKQFKNSSSELVATMNNVQAMMEASGMVKNTSDIDAIRKVHARGARPLPGDFLYKFGAASTHRNQAAANAILRKRVKTNAAGSRLRKVSFPPHDNDIDGGSIANTGASNNFRDQPSPNVKPTRIGNQIIGAPSRTNMQAAVDAIKQDLARGAKRMG